MHKLTWIEFTTLGIETTRNQLMERVFLSEYVSDTRTAHIYMIWHLKTYVVECWQQDYKAIKGPFSTLITAENIAEDWVLGRI